MQIGQPPSYKDLFPAQEGAASAPNRTPLNKTPFSSQTPTVMFNCRGMTVLVETPEILSRVINCSSNHLTKDLYQCLGGDGHLLCRQCLHYSQKNQLLQDSRSGNFKYRCPIDNAKVVQSERLTLELKTHPSYCPLNLNFGNNSCEWQGTYDELEAHIGHGCENITLKDKITMLENDQSDHTTALAKFRNCIDALLNRVDQLETQIKKPELPIEKRVVPLEKKMELLQQEMEKLTLQVNRSLQAQRQQSSTPLPPGFAQRLNDLERSFGQNCQKLENLEAELASFFRLFCEFRNEKKPDLPATASTGPVDKVNNTSVPTNGTLIWKIDDFASKRQDAIDGRKLFISSPVFLTSQNGYKLSARAYLNGDGMAKGSHISLFLVVMRGEYDALLDWPFSHKVTFKILDQNRVKDVKNGFFPNKDSSSFKRPTRETNIASGCPTFMTFNSLNDPLYAYVKDDTMFIQITVGDTDQSPQDSLQGRIN